MLARPAAPAGRLPARHARSAIDGADRAEAACRGGTPVVLAGGVEVALLHERRVGVHGVDLERGTVCTLDPSTAWAHEVAAGMWIVVEPDDGAGSRIRARSLRVRRRGRAELTRSADEVTAPFSPLSFGSV